MSDLIDFLERMGGDAESRFAAGPELEEALTHAGIAPTVRSAVLAGDQLQLESLLGARHTVCTLINLPDEEEEEDEEEEDDEEQEDEEGDDHGADDE
jgi:hypothetical protein